MRLVLATSNSGKIKEFQALLAPLGWEVLALKEFTDVSPAESGLTFMENAILKARHAARTAHLPAIADDSGLEVEALQGAPGIYSARYAGEGASDTQNLQRLLATLQGVPPTRRTARYCCALAFLRHERDPFPLLSQASWAGRIIDTPRGSGGFGYDPVFELPERGLTVAELPAEEKNRLSHRAQALHALAAQLQAEQRPGSSG